MAELGFGDHPTLDAPACDINVQPLSLVLVLLSTATSVRLSTPVIDEIILVLVVAVVQDEYLLIKREVVVVLLRYHVVFVDNLLLGCLLLLVAVLGLKQPCFVSLKIAPLLAQFLHVGVHLVDALHHHDSLLVDVLELANVQAALPAELGEARLDFVQALVLLDLEFVLAPDATSDSLSGRWRRTWQVDVWICARVSHILATTVDWKRARYSPT
jgi:hypothetical protein